MAKTKGQVSAGIHSNVNKKLLNELRRDRVASGEKQEALSAAWRRGENPWVTVANPKRENTRERFIRVRANDAWGFYDEEIAKKAIIAAKQTKPAKVKKVAEVSKKA